MWIWIASYVADIPCSSRDGMDATGTWQRCRLQPIDAVPDTHSLGCTLPSPQWFEDLVMHHQICTGVPTDETSRSSMLRCLAKVLPGKCHSELVGFDCEEQLLHDFFHRAGDAYSLQIDQVWLLEGGPRLLLWNQGLQHGSITRVSPSRGWAFLAAHMREGLQVRPPASAVHFDAGHVVHPQALAHVPMLYVPEVVAELVAKNAWVSLICLARWSHYVHRTDAFRCHLEWPSKQELRLLLQQGRVGETQRPSITIDTTVLSAWAKQLRQWAPRILSADGQDDVDLDDERNTLKEMISQMDAVSWDMGRTGAHLAFDPAVRLIQTMRLVFDLRDRSNLTRVCKRAIEVIGPSSLKNALLQRLQRVGGRSLALSRGQVSKSQMFLDAAMMLCRRDDEHLLPMSRVFLVDSSPQVGRDFLCIRGVSVPRRNLIDMFSKHRDLVKLEMAWRAPDEDEGQEAEPDPHRDEIRAALVQDLASLIQSRVLPPAGLGSAASSLVHKISAFTFSLWLESGTLPSLSQVLDETFAFVVDLGTESGMSEFMCTGLLTVLPVWLAKSLDLDGDLDADYAADRQGDGADGREADEEGGGRLENHLFKACVVIPGMCHILNNADADVDKSMPYWETYYKQLQTLHKLLGDAQRLSRFREKCLEGTVYECKSKPFRTPVKPIAEWRWGSVTGYLTRLIEMGPTLEKAWDAKAYKHQGAQEANPAEDDRAGERGREGFDVAQITAIIKDPLFWSFTLMAVQVKQFTKKMLAWAEGCLCHSRSLKDETIDRQRRHFARELDMDPTDVELRQLHIFKCCMAGMRAPEIAHGEHMVRFHELAESAQATILCEYSGKLTDAQQAIVILNFEAARDSLAFVLTTKLDFWERLPWATAGLAFHDEARAKSHFSNLAEIYDRMPGPDNQHRVAIELFEGVVRDELNDWAASDNALTHYPHACSSVARWLTVTVIERPVEALHSIVKRGAGYRYVSIPYVSLKMRWPEQEARLHMEGIEFLDKLAASLKRVSSVRKLVKVFKLSGHPWLRRQYGDEARRTMHAKVAKILYHMDSHTQYLARQAAADYHTSAKRKLADTIKKILKQPAPLPITFASVLGLAFVEYLQGANLKQSTYYSLPKDLFHIGSGGGDAPPEAGPEVRDMKQQFSTPWPLADEIREEGAQLGGAVADSEDDALECDVAMGEPVELQHDDVWPEDVDVREANEEEAMEAFEPPPAERLYFKIVHANPSKKRRVQVMPGAGPSDPLQSRDIAITICEPISKQADGTVVVSSRASKISVASLVSTCLLRDLSRNFEATRCSLIRHEMQKHLSFTFPGYTSPGYGELVSDMVAATAYAGSDRDFVVADGAADRLRLLGHLQRAGFVAARPSLPGSTAWQFTRDGRASLCSGVAIGTSSLLCDVSSDRAHHQMTRYELLQEMEVEGWQWQRMVAKRQKQLPPHRVGDEKVFLTSSVFAKTSRWYLVALLNTEELASRGCDGIDHGQDATFYKKLLSNKEIVDPEALEDDVARGPEPIEDGAEEDEEDDTSDGGGDGGDGGDDDSGGGGGDGGDGGDDDPGGGGGVAADGDGPPEDGKDEPVADEPVASPDVPADGDAAHRHGPPKDPWNLLGEDRHWGCFLFTYKTGDSYQAQCPWHKKSSATGCKKTMACGGPSREQHELCIRRLRFWCSDALAYDRQRHHRGWHPTPEQTPPMEVIDGSLSGSLVDGPAVPNEIPTDDQLDEEDAEQADALAKAKAKPKRPMGQGQTQSSCEGCCCFS